MPLHPPLGEAPRFPVTSLIAIAAIGVSVRWWMGYGMSGMAPGPGSIVREPWTLVTSIIPHVNPVHLLFNLSWWWVLGTRIERAWGAARLIGVVALLAIVSSGAEYAIGHSGVGLSGVIYGLATMLWVVQSRYAALAGTISRRSLEILGVWFLLCIVLTVTKVAPIGNMAHGAGAVCGWVLGKCIVAEGRRRAGWVAAILGMVVVVGVGATVGRPWVNVARWTSSDAYRGYAALREKQYDEAIRLLEAAAQKEPNSATTFVNLGSAYVGKQRYREAREAYIRAIAIKPSEREKLSPQIALTIDQEIGAAAKKADLEGVKSMAGESLRWNSNDEYAKKMLEWAVGVEGEKKKEGEKKEGGG